MGGLSTCSDEGNQTELLESGPEVSADELAAFTAKFDELVKQADCVTVSDRLQNGSHAMGIRPFFHLGREARNSGKPQHGDGGALG